MKSKLYNISKEEWQKLLDTSNNYEQIFSFFELKTSSNNRKRLKQVIKEYDLDTTQFETNYTKYLLSKNIRKKSRMYEISKEEFQTLLDTSNTYIDILNYFELKHPNNRKKLKQIIKEYNLDTTQFETNRRNYLNNTQHVKKNINEKLVKNTHQNSSKLKKELFKNNLKEEKCEICGITNWNNKQLIFELHHMDGDPSNNELNNLQILCPNCHSQTDNYCKNKNLKKIKYSNKNSVNNSKKTNSQKLIKGSKFRNDSIKKELFKNDLKEEKCEICGITTWNNKQLIFELHHIDGDSSNNELNNLQILCSNCHSQTDNYKIYNRKFENKKKITNKEICPICNKNLKLKKSKMCKTCSNKEKNKKTPPITRNELKKLIRTESFSQIGKMFNVTDNTIKKWCKKYELPYQKYKINEYTDAAWFKI